MKKKTDAVSSTSKTSLLKFGRLLSHDVGRRCVVYKKSTVDSIIVAVLSRFTVQLSRYIPPSQHPLKAFPPKSDSPGIVSLPCPKSPRLA